MSSEEKLFGKWKQKNEKKNRKKAQNRMNDSHMKRYMYGRRNGNDIFMSTDH